MKNNKLSIQRLEEILPLMGHRNWILVVDKAYPLQSSQGIEYVDTGAPLLPVLEKVLDTLSQAPHVSPILYLDRELDFMDDTLSPGVEALKKEVARLTEGWRVSRILHDEVFSRLDAASKLFNVLVVKTESQIPYTSVFIELDCGYWSPDREATLRERLSQAK